MVLQARTNLRWMLEGVTLAGPGHGLHRRDVVIGRDSIVYPTCAERGNTTWRRVLRVSRVPASWTAAPRQRRCDQGLLRSSRTAGSRTGPPWALRPSPARHRPQRRLAHRQFRRGQEVRHRRGEQRQTTWPTLGDATVGRNVNIGAGVITCTMTGTEAPGPVHRRTACSWEATSSSLRRSGSAGTRSWPPAPRDPRTDRAGGSVCHQPRAPGDPGKAWQDAGRG